MTILRICSKVVAPLGNATFTTKHFPQQRLASLPLRSLIGRRWYATESTANGKQIDSAELVRYLAEIEKMWDYNIRFSVIREYLRWCYVN